MMKRVVLLMVFLCEALYAQATLPVEGRWTGEIHVTADVVVPTGATLNVESANVRFDKNTRLLVQGIIRASKSTFRAAATQPSAGDWHGITIEPAAMAFMPNAQGASSIEGCTISDAHTAVRVVGRDLLQGVKIAGNRITRCRWGGIVIEGVRVPQVSNNDLNEICLDGLSDQGRPVAMLKCADGKIIGNTIRNSSDTGIFLANCSGFILAENRTEKIVGGPGPGPGGYYKQWGFGAMLIASSDNRIERNAFVESAYDSVCLAYGSHRNLIEHNVCDIGLAAFNIVGEGADNVFRDNKVNGGWTVLYVCGDGPVRYERCNIDGGGGACFTARTGTSSFVDCDWKNTAGMNFWGGTVRVERCRLTKQLQYAASLQNDCRGTMIDCEFDKNDVKIDAKATGSITVSNTLTVEPRDADSGKPITTFTVTARPAMGEPVVFTTAKTTLTELIFTAAGKKSLGQYKVSIAAEGFEDQSINIAMNRPTTIAPKLRPRGT
jgi:parallel beta-helix repeat protein